MSDLSAEEILRYQRHLTLPGFGEASQLNLKAARVLVIGAGGLGCPALQYLAAAGTGTLGIVDDDVVSQSNLQRQILFTDADVGAPKAEVAAARLKAMNPFIDCQPYVTRLGADNALELIRAYDVVLDGSDNFTTRYLINDACVLAGKPLIYGALHTFQGQATVLNYEGGPTYRCLFPQPPDPADAPNCSEIGVLGVLPGMIGIIQATETIKVVTGIGSPLVGRLLLFDALDMSRQIIHFTRVPEQAAVTELKEVAFACASAGAMPESEPSPIDEISPGELHAALEVYQILDVREAWERQICKLPGAHLPLAMILAGHADFAAAEIDPNRPVCVYCKGGVRSVRAAEAMRARYGFRKIASLRGGIVAWGEACDTTMQLY